jgi:GNAT superfamily N-acetyltransferase
MTDQPGPTPTADSSVRSARVGDADAMARLTLAWWHRWFSSVIPSDEFEGPSLDDVTQAWALSIASPPSPRHQVLVAVAGPTLVGYAVTAPTDDADSTGTGTGTGEIVDLVVAAEHTRSGHGSRLLAAGVDHLRSHGFDEVGLWCLAGDFARREFLESAGFAASGATRRLDMGEGTSEVEQVRFLAGLG